jgi:2-polyprenyl-6-methoxyphenol hydroxylase-like FAD-dependent oxidoreductase
VRSTVRGALGLGFPGRSAVQSMMLADVRLRETPGEALSIAAGADGFALVASFGDGWHRVIAWNRAHQLPDGAAVDFDDLRETTRGCYGTDFGMHDPRWTSRFHSDERQVARYRSGRVLLAGDAAHVHSPAGGLGMNAGLQDAANLGWKLAAQAQGRAPAGLLDSYHA